MLEIHQKIDNDPSATINDTVALDFDRRQKSRIRVTLTSGQAAAIFMERGSILRDGELLQADDGSIIKVIAAEQEVMIVEAESAHKLMRAAYHLGNRHVPLEIGEHYLKLESDYVLKDMLLGLDVKVIETSAAFEPESGAYGGGHHHGDHEHHHSHEHDHAH